MRKNQNDISVNTHTFQVFKTWKVYPLFSSLLAFAFLNGCSSLGGDPELYLLSSLSGQTLQTAKPLPIVALKPVELPKYLKSFRIMLRKNDNQLEQTKGQRWAEPLTDNFTRVLARDLAQRLGLQQVYIYPSQAPKHVDILVNVVVNHFIGAPQDGVDLNAHWRLFVPKDRKIIYKDTLVHHQALTASPANTAALVHAMSQTIAALSEHIAAQIVRERD